MKFSKLQAVLITIALQVGIIAFLVITKMLVVTGGTDVVLSIFPVDPRDPFRGDYITFQYDISTIPQYRVGKDISVGSIVYVPLRRNGKLWVADQSYNPDFTHKPEAGTLFIKGVVKEVTRSFDELAAEHEGAAFLPEASPVSGVGYDMVVVSFGVEEYFIPEGTGHNVTFFDKDMTAQLSIDADGNAVLKKVFLDGQPWP